MTGWIGSGSRAGVGVTALWLGLALVLWSLPAAAGPRSCSRADARLARTGKGDRDGDGLSNCRERRMLGTSPSVADTDHDGMDDGEEVAAGTDPLDPDSDDDGLPDGADDSPAPPPLQKLEAFVDGLVCPTEGGAGSITALGVTAVLDAATTFEDGTCEELQAALEGGSPAFAEIKILEDEAGGLTAVRVELDDHGLGGDDDQDDDQQGDHGGGD
jgi:Bacterial TSP3 repeat